MKRRIRATLCGAALAFSALGLAAPPAIAAPAAGTSTGFFNAYDTVDVSPLAPLPLCVMNTSPAVLTLNNVALLGNLAGAADANTTATITMAAGTLFYNPAGTFTDASCTVPAIGPTGAPASMKVTSGTSSTDLCGGSGTATYGRASEVGLVLGSCAGSTIVFDGAQQPCLTGAPFDPCVLVGEWIGTYEQI